MGSPMQDSVLFWLFLLLPISICVPFSGKAADVGVILDLDTTLGKICRTCISMAVKDFYLKHNYTTMIVPHFRNSSNHAVAAASAAIDLLKNTQVIAILGPQKSSQADFVVDIGEEVRVPIISFATSPALSPEQSPYFIRSAWCSSSQAKAIAGVVKAFGWREVVFVYEDSDYGRGLLPFLTEHLLYINALVSYQSVFSLNSNNSQIHAQLVKLMSMQVRVFVVHVSPALASRFFQMVKETGMMSEGYGWIVADPLTSLLDSLDSDAIEAMQGVVGVKAYVPKTKELKDFTRRWSKRFHEENPDMDRTELNVFGLWAYDSITALAKAVERVGVVSPKFQKPVYEGVSTDLEAIGTSNVGPSLAHFIRNYRFKGLSGDFNITNGELEPIAFEVVNVVGRGGNRVGFWTEEFGISKELNPKNKRAVNSTNMESFGGILWPGQTTVVPKGWELPISGKKLRIGVSVRKGFTEFTKVERDAETGVVEATGFCIDVFTEAMGLIPYVVPYEFVAMESPHGPSVEDISGFAARIFSGDQKFDAVAGDVTITANRSEFVDFTFPYTESGVAAIVPIKGDTRKNAWIFMQPLTTALWLTIGAFFIFTGFVVWALEHRVNKEFRGSPLQQVGMMFWFSFSTLVFAHKEKVRSNLTRFVVIVWVFVVLVLTSSYTANLTSMLTVDRLQPSLTDINDLIRNRDYVGFQDGSFVSGSILSHMNFDRSMFRYYSSFDEYDEALSKGSSNGGVSAIVDELPYIRLFLSKYCHKYTMIGPIYQTSGFGFVFPKGSPLVPDVSRAILKLKEGEAMLRISRKWFENREGCNSSDGTVITSKSLNVDSFKGLFLISGLSSSLALAIFMSMFMYENRYVWSSTASFKQKLCGLARVFVQEKEKVDAFSSKESARAESPAVSIPRDEEQEGMFRQDESISTMESVSIRQE